MRKYFATKGVELTPLYLGKVLSKFQTENIPIFNKRYNYYIGKQDILLKQQTADYKPCNRIVTNFIKEIIYSYSGYAMGQGVSYSSDLPNFERLQDILNYNDVDDEDSNLFTTGLWAGLSAELCFIDEEGQTRFRWLDPREIIPIYDNSIMQELMACVRFYREDLLDETSETYIVEVYDSKYKTVYRSGPGFSSFSLINKELHHFNDVPVTIFNLNPENEGVADTVFSLQDAYNALLSDSIDDWDYFVDCILTIQGATTDSEGIKQIKEDRVMILDEGCTANYLIKDTNTTEIQNLLTTVEAKIREMSACPNFSSETFNTSSGIAIRFRTLAMENKVASILNNFKKTLQRRLELLSDIEQLKDTEAIWRDVKIEFHRNIPADVSTQYNTLMQLKGLVSDETLLSQIDFVENPAEELKKVQEQQERNMELYSFQNGMTNENEDNEE